MAKIGIYSVSDRYITFLRSDRRLRNVFDNKEDTRSHTRKYLGIVFMHNGFHYYIPFSSPKKTDYYIKQDGTREAVLYRQKTNAEKLFADKSRPKYLENTVDFVYAEEKCREFESLPYSREQ